MGSRIELQTLLEKLLGSRNVYYMPPENLKMSYPCIRYYKTKIDTKKANNSTYKTNNRYELIVMDRRPDNPVINKLLSLPYCSYDRPYTADNIYHDVLTIYF